MLYLYYLSEAIHGLVSQRPIRSFGALSLPFYTFCSPKKSPYKVFST